MITEHASPRRCVFLFGRESSVDHFQARKWPACASHSVNLGAQKRTRTSTSCDATDLNRARLPIPPSGHFLRVRTLIAIGFCVNDEKEKNHP